MTSVETASARWLPYLGMSAVVAGNVTANIFIKLGANPGAGALRFGPFGWQTVVGIGFFGLAVLLYAWSLKYMPLHIAQLFGVVQFMGVMFAAALLFQEAITLRQWVGIALIVVGLIVVSR